jgi:hypothetical protein
MRVCPCVSVCVCVCLCVSVYDTTDSESFTKAKNWVKELRKMVGQVSLYTSNPIS